MSAADGIKFRMKVPNIVKHSHKHEKELTLTQDMQGLDLDGADPPNVHPNIEHQTILS